MSKKGLNIQYPLQDDIENKYFLKRTKTPTEAVKSDILLLLTTNKGDRFYNREYGVNLLKFLFEPNDKLSQFDVEEDIKISVSRFIPNVTVSKVEILNKESNSNVFEESINEESKSNTIQVIVTFTYSSEFFTETDKVIVEF